MAYSCTQPSMVPRSALRRKAGTATSALAPPAIATGLPAHTSRLNTSATPCPTLRGATPVRAILRACVALSSEGDACLLLPGRHATSTALRPHRPSPGGLHVSQKRNLTVGAAPEPDWPAGTSGTEAVLDGTVDFEGWVRHEDAHGEYFLSRRSYAADELPWQLFIDDVQELRGATARAPLAAGEELCRVPRGRTLDLASVAPGESPCPKLAPPRLWSSLAWCGPRWGWGSS